MVGGHLGTDERNIVILASYGQNFPSKSCQKLSVDLILNFVWELLVNERTYSCTADVTAFVIRGVIGTGF